MKSNVEGMRALTYFASFAIDKEMTVEDDAEKEKWHGLLEILTPIIKAYCSDVGFKVAELAIQVYGGYGYCADYPVEQFLRDVKIASLYEGANGVQALDLIGRKLGMKKGAHVLSGVSLADNGQAAAVLSTPDRPGVLVTFTLALPDAFNALVDVNADILDGDLLAVHAAPEAESGQIVVARLGDEVTVKRLRRDRRSPHRVVLRAENPDFAPIEIDLRRDPLVIEGIGVGLVRNLVAEAL